MKNKSWLLLLAAFLANSSFADKGVEVDINVLQNSSYCFDTIDTSGFTKDWDTHYPPTEIPNCGYGIFSAFCPITHVGSPQGYVDYTDKSHSASFRISILCNSDGTLKQVSATPNYNSVTTPVLSGNNPFNLELTNK